MKYKISKSIIIILLLLAPLLMGCEFSQNNYGYPHKVTLSRKGETVTVNGELAFYSFSIIHDGDEFRSMHVEGKTFEAIYDWLTVSWEKDSKTIMLMAQPRTSGKKRHLYVRGDYGNEYALIKVEQ